ncbi:hypothetical protein MKW94_013036 [Papaver nudicaule]|uniref:mRNA-decapping enzyme-like protein n=1 Tax=Papaver nudicaule TaxID=74823 RepID=A0AA41VFA2_PAPNU|nr:hypothetical protein [Papaver nudicaule]MCL7040209.1 hypothetical protein [Papaver nudicaule]
MAQNSGKLTPNLDKETTKILNLTVLQRIDPNIEEILITAAHVTFYEFDVHRNEWSRKDVEGSLFVVKRNTQPRFQFIVMNRRNTDNLVEDLLGDFEFEIQLPYLLYRNSAEEVTGIWFFDARECEDVANLFNRILGAYAKVSPKPKVSPTKDEFEALEPVPNMAVMGGPLELSLSTVSRDVPADCSLANLFSGARNMGNTSKAANQEQQHPSPATMPVSSHVPSGLISSQMATLQLPSAHPSASSTPLSHMFETPGTSNTNRVTNLVKPSVFSAPTSTPSALLMPPMSSPAVATAPIHHSPVNSQQLHEAHFLQPFPQPSPPTPISDPGVVITRDRVRQALVKLAQNNQFIDMFCEELLKA